ncbi:MAG: hypothetical protein M3416_00005 [Acidobacteriota bacterium]|nr:hypothetical protein [Acidobacteriota bacterium]
MIGWILTIFVGLLALMILVKIWRGDIDLNYLISDELGYASLSRFQFLIFTFVVAISLFYLIVNKTPPGYPDIPNEILALLGISGGSYVVSKGIQNSRDVSLTEANNPPKEAPEKPTNTPIMGDDEGTPATGTTTTSRTTTSRTTTPPPTTPPMA